MVCLVFTHNVLYKPLGMVHEKTLSSFHSIFTFAFYLGHVLQVLYSEKLFITYYILVYDLRRYASSGCPEPSVSTRLRRHSKREPLPS